MNRNNLILLIPHYNDELGLCKSISSISKDENIDILIVDDGSDENLNEDKIEKYFKGTGTVFFKYLKENKGIEVALNEGLGYILKRKEYIYIARLDCGDICVKDRFLIQQEFLELNKDIALVGANVDFLDVEGNYLYTLNLPLKDKQIRKKMFINAMHIHPTIMFRKDILKTTGLYPTAYKAAEDYAFFFVILKSFKVANINKVLVRCEMNPKGISSIFRKNQTKNRILLIKKNFYFGFYPIYGLLRALFLFILPLKVSNAIKLKVKK